jgi:thioredoxin reductase (NADPH)
MMEKVAYRLLEPEDIQGKDILVVGGGDSAIESALLLCDHNNVTLSYRSEAFSRLKPLNSQKIQQASESGRIRVLFNTSPVEIKQDAVLLKDLKDEKEFHLVNNLVYIFAGGELPIQFLQKAGIMITKKFGEAILKHN